MIEFKFSDSSNLSNGSSLQYTNNLFDLDIDDSISNVYAQHHQTVNPEYRNVAEFRTDDDQWTYLIIAVKYIDYILIDGKTKSVKTIRYFDSNDWVNRLFKDIRSLSFIFIKLLWFDQLSLMKFRDEEHLMEFEKDYKSSFIYKLLDMLLKMNEVLDCITIEGKLNAQKDKLKKIVQYYVRDQNEERRENNKEMRKQIMVEFGNLIFEDDPEFKITTYSDVGDGSFISFSGFEDVKVQIEQEEEINLDDSNKTIEINDNDLSNRELESDYYRKQMINFIDTSIQ